METSSSIQGKNKDADKIKLVSDPDIHVTEDMEIEEESEWDMYCTCITCAVHVQVLYMYYSVGSSLHIRIV